MKIFESNFWYGFQDDLEKFLEGKRFRFLGFYLTVVVPMSVIITPWFLVLLVLPFIYSLFEAYRYRNDDFVGAAIWSRSW